MIHLSPLCASHFPFQIPSAILSLSCICSCVQLTILLKTKIMGWGHFLQVPRMGIRRFKKDICHFLFLYCHCLCVVVQLTDCLCESWLHWLQTTQIGRVYNTSCYYKQSLTSQRPCTIKVYFLTLLDIVLGKEFLTKPPKASATKTKRNKWDLNKLEGSVQQNK